MTTQSEASLENDLIDQLQTLGYEKVRIRNEDDLVRNLKGQLEKHNRTTLSDNEFKQVLNKIARGNIFDKAKILRDKVSYTRDDGKTAYIDLINKIMWCKNEFQVTHQITMEGTYENRYDVTLLVNGLPLAQIELKRRGLELKEAFNQTNRYHRHSYSAGLGLFNYIQVFVISNGLNTKYYANNPVNKRDFKQTFYWAEKDNQRITQLSEFADVFLEKCQLSKLITKYIVLNESLKLLMVLRQYQYHAVEAIVERVKNSRKFGYIWHTTGSGKTLTSFKTAQILTGTSNVHKVLFVVDRKDLDNHTITEFNSYKKGCVDGSNNTRMLVEQLEDDTKLIVTTLQKLNNALSKRQYSDTTERLRDERMVFIFDECHRSQFGVTHKRICEHFPEVQMFGFTGTPIFAENSTTNEHGRRTTIDLFEECLHKYVITDAIKDENVLKFSVEYISTFKEKENIKDIQVEAIDTAEILESEQRLDSITDHIIANHDRKTHNREFNAIFCVSNIKTLVKYYELFKRKKENGEHNLKIATIFSYQVNEDDSDADGFIETDITDETSGPVNVHSRDSLDSFISDYNGAYGTNYSTKDSFYQYYEDIGKRVKRKEIDILLVVNMFLTGFDSQLLNTIYVDKKLRYHGLIQAYSRTNRIMGTKKSQGNVMCFRYLKPATDEAIALFANKEAVETIILEPYEKYVETFNKAVAKLLNIAGTVDGVNDLLTEEDEKKFITAFRNLIRLMNVLVSFKDFTFDDLAMNAQTFEDYKSKYLDLYDKVKTGLQKEKVSILDDIDFETELIHRDNINVNYIINLLIKMQNAKPGDRDKHLKLILRTLETETRLRSKKELIKRFIERHMADIPEDGNVGEAFKKYWEKEKQKAYQTLYETEGLDKDALEKTIGDFLYTGKTPLYDDITDIMHEPPKLEDFSMVCERIIEKINSYVDTYLDGID